MMSKRLLALASALSLAGCTSFPDAYKELKADSQMVAQQMEQQWSATPAIQYVPSRSGLDLRKRFALPPAVAGRVTSYELKERVTLAQLLDALNSQDYRILTRGVSQDKLAERISLPRFSGSFEELLQTLALAHGLDFEYEMGVVMLTSGARYLVGIPQHKDFAERIKAGLEAIGAARVKSDHALGMATFEANMAQASDVQLLLERFAANASMIGLQVAVIDLNLNRNADRGFDWSALSAGWGSLIGTPIANSLLTGGATSGSVQATSPIGGSGTGTGSGGVGGAGDGSTATRVLGALGALTGNGVALRYEAEKFSLSAAVKLLSRYGNARTTQDALTHTLAGTPAKISSVTSVPYVTSMGAAASSGGAVVGSSSTANVDIGLTVEIEPQYDFDDNLVLSATTLKLSSLIGFRELQTSSATGAWKQPEVQKLEFENLSRLRPGEVVMIGGITYDQSTANYTSLPGMEKVPVGSESVTLSKHAIFLAIRPTVTIFAPQGSKAARAALAALMLEGRAPSGQIDPEGQ